MKGIPFSVGKFLMEAIARVRRIYLVRGFAAVGIVWLLGIVAVMVVDSRIVIFDDRIRWAMTAGVWLVALVAAMLSVVWPLRRRLDFRRMAAILDRRHPEQEERLSTLVELSESDAAKAGFSASLFALVCDFAENDVAKLDLRREFPVFGAWRRFGVFAAMALALGIGAVVSPNLVGRLFVRAVAPWSDIGNLFSDEIAVKPGDITILSGSVIRIEAKAKDECAIRISRRRGLGWTEETSEAMAGGVYETTADLNEREWRYRVTAGHAVTRYYYVRVSQMPKYDLFTATVDYPAYTRMRPLVVSNADVGAITAIQGTRVKFDVRVSDPGTLVDFRIGKEPLFEHTMVSNKTSSWSLDLVNGDGFRAEKGRHPLKSVIDQPPTVLIEKPTGTLRLPPHAKIPVEITATDDVSIDDFYLRVSIDGEPWERHYGTKIELPADRRFVRTVADVDLSLYDLIFAKNIRFDIVVSDGCPAEFGGPHSATSTPFTVQFAADEANYAMQELKQEVDDARRDIDEARKRLNDAQNLARQVRDELRRNEKVPEATEQKGERLAHELDEAAKRVEELRNDFLADERFAPLTRPLDRMLEEDVRPALTEVENAQFRDREERADAVDAAIPEMAKAVQELDELKRRLDERAAKVDAFEKAKDLAARQEALAKAAKEIVAERPTDTAKLEAWKRLEDAAMRRADELSRTAPSPDLDEAKRKMESAVRKMEDLKRELAEAARQAKDAKARAERREAERKAGPKPDDAGSRAAKDAEWMKTAKPEELEARDRALAEAAGQQSAAETALDEAAGLRAEERTLRQKGDPDAAGGKAKASQAAEKRIVEAQKSAEAALERGKATEGVKAMQKMAAQAERNAAQAPRDAERSVKAAQAQAAASAALRKEQEIRADMRKGTATAADLEAMDREFRRQAKEAGEELAAEAAQDATRDRERVSEAARRQQELKNAANSQTQAAQAQKRRDHKAVQRAQKDAEDRLERGGATDSVKALQQLASEAARAAQRDPDSKERDAAAEAAQKAAADALKRELDIREGMRKGEMTEDDLDALDRELMEGLVRNAAARTRSAQDAAASAMKAARDAVGSEESEALDRLATAALQAKRDALAAELSESKLRDDERRADALRDAADGLDAVEAADAEAAATEAKILSQQQGAVQALERNDRGRAMDLQREIAQAQVRAAEALEKEGDAAEAREAANEAQESAQESAAAAHADWNNDTKAAAVKAQREAMEREREAQDEARTMRALNKLSALEGAGAPQEPGAESAGDEAGDDQGRAEATDAAQAATDAMDREVNAQAAALGMSRRKADAGSAKGRGKERSSSGGGDLSDEVSDLAKELKRNDAPDFLKSLFSRLGWFKIRGLSRDGLGTRDLKDIPPEYRDLVRRYFLKISEENP